MATEKKTTATRGRTEAPPPPLALDATKRGLFKPKRIGKTAKADGTGTVSATERALMIAHAAYHRAERRGFSPGHELEDWLAAEHEINHLLGSPVTSDSGTEG